MTVTMEHIATGKTIEEAIEAGCAALGLDRDSVSVEVSILIKYGFTIPAVAAAVQEAVFNAISNTSGLDVACVNVNVAGVAFEREEKA